MNAVDRMRENLRMGRCIILGAEEAREILARIDNPPLLGLDTAEWHELEIRIGLALLDKRGQAIRMLAYAEKVDLLQRLIVTVRDLTAENARLRG